MTRPNRRTHGLRRKSVRLPSGRRTLHFQARHHASPVCSRCGTQLHGVIQGRKVASSLHTPTRPFAGVLCHDCLASEIRSLARSGLAE